MMVEARTLIGGDVLVSTGRGWSEPDRLTLDKALAAYDAALKVNGPEDLDAIRCTECPGAAEVRDVRERFFAVPVRPVGAERPTALRQNLTGGDIPKAGVA